jgi:VanZ family protein
LIVIWCSVIFIFTEVRYFSGDHTALVIDKVIHHTLVDASPAEVHDTEPHGVGTLNYMVRKASHMIVFGILAFLLWQAIHPKKFSYLIAWVFTTLYASLDEWHQSFVPWRSSHVSDVIIDSMAALAILLFIFIKNKKKKTPYIYLLTDYFPK